MQLVAALTYDINLENWDINRINIIAKTYNKVFGGIVFRLQHLQGEKLEKIQQFQDTGFQTSAASITTLFKKPLTAIDVGRYNIYNRRNNYQPAPTPVFNLRSTAIELYLNDSTSINDHQLVLNGSTSKIKKDRKCIFKYLTASVPPIQAFSLPAPSVQVPSRPALLIQTPIAKKAFLAKVLLAQILLA